MAMENNNINKNLDQPFTVKQNNICELKNEDKVFNIDDIKLNLPRKNDQNLEKNKDIRTFDDLITSIINIKYQNINERLLNVDANVTHNTILKTHATGNIF